METEPKYNKGDCKRVAIFDGDMVKYSCAYSSENSWIEVKSKKTGEIQQHSGRKKFYDFMNQWCEEKGKEKNSWNKDLFTITDVQKKLPKRVLEANIRSYIDDYTKASGCIDYRILVGIDKGHRPPLATLQEYKGGRDGLKPLYLKDAEKILLEKYRGEPYSIMEADDGLSVLGTEFAEKGENNPESVEAVFIYEDKDNKQVPYHWEFNPKTSKVPTWNPGGYGEISLNDKKKIKFKGNASLAIQMLLGDGVDNICGRFKLDKNNKILTRKDTKDRTQLVKIAYGDTKIFNDTKDFTELPELWSFVVQKFKQWYPEDVIYNHWETQEEIITNWFGIASEVFTLLYMKRTVDDETTLEDYLESYGVNYD